MKIDVNKDNSLKLFCLMPDSGRFFAAHSAQVVLSLK